MSSSASRLPGAVFSSNAASSRTSAMATSDAADAGFLLTSGSTSTGIVGPCDPPQKDLLLPIGMLTSFDGSGGVGPIICCFAPPLQPTPATRRQPNTHHLLNIRPSMAYLGMGRGSLAISHWPVVIGHLYPPFARSRRGD